MDIFSMFSGINKDHFALFKKAYKAFNATSKEEYTSLRAEVLKDAMKFAGITDINSSLSSFLEANKNNSKCMEYLHFAKNAGLLRFENGKVVVDSEKSMQMLKEKVPMADFILNS